MTTKLAQIVAYLDPELKTTLEKVISKQPTRMSVSAYVAGLLKRHLETKRAGL